MGALVAPPLEPGCDIRVIVADDNGGAIFSTLEQGALEYEGVFERVFGTPQDVDLAAVAGALGWDTVTVTDDPALRDALSKPVRGRQLITASLRRDDRRATEARLRELGRLAT